MKYRVRCTLAAALGTLTLTASGCSATIPLEPVPEGWALDVHQSGQWWTQPLIPRSVVVQRCPPPPAWSSEPNLNQVKGLPPGTSVEYSLVTDDYHCAIGWSQPAGSVAVSSAELTTEDGLRRFCSASGLPIDSGWRYLGLARQRVIGDSRGPASDWPQSTVLTAAFIDRNQTVVSCLVDHLDVSDEGAGRIEPILAGPAAAGPQQCPVQPRDLARSDAGTVEEYQLRGAGSLRDDQGRVLTDAATVQFVLDGDSVASTHQVTSGMVVVDVVVAPSAAIEFEWNSLPQIEGRVYGADGALLATCRS